MNSLRELLLEIKQAYMTVLIHGSIIFFLYFAIEVLWVALELWLIGETQPSAPDAIIGAMLAVAIWKLMRIKVTFEKQED